ncbi:MAG TPA: hypothetical protein VK530_08570 [Candidatus Acidoferrum sp.]|nr:hypothetical protein [Candidatus Acidoferrum sp.]
MTRDKQLLNVDLDQVIEKRRLDQALNAKEFAVLAGVSYSAARSWFRQPGFPALLGVVFWQDFTKWRQSKMDASNFSNARSSNSVTPNSGTAPAFTGKAAALLAEAD